MSQTEELRGLLKVAEDQLLTSREVIAELAHRVGDLEHQVQARDLTIKLASEGRVPLSDLPEKVASLEGVTAEELELEQKLASYQQDGPGHILSEESDHGTSGAMAFINP